MTNRGPRFNPAVVGLVAASMVFGLLIFAFTNVSLFASSMDVKAEVATGDTLAPSADVEVAGVKVGVVKSISKGDPGALIDISLDTKKVTLYKDTTLLIRPHGVFGPKFVELDPGTPSAGLFPERAAIPISNTRVSVDLEQVFNELDTNTRQSLQTVFYELGTGAQNRGADFGQVIDKLSTVETQLTPVLQVVDNRAFNTGRLLESSAVVNETLAASPLDQIIRKNADVLTKLDIASASVSGVLVHGNNALVALDAITGGSNTQALSTTISKLPVLFDNLQLFNNALGYGVNSLLPEITPQRGQALSDIGLAIARTQDAFGQCDISDQNSPAAADTPHANIVKIAPCYGADGRPYVDPITGHVAHHHVNVLLGLHTNPQVAGLSSVTASPAVQSAIKALNTAAPNSGTSFLSSLVAENEGSVICGPNSGNGTRPNHPAFTCKTDPVQSKAIPGFGTPPPPLYVASAGANTAAEPSTTLSAVAGLPNTSSGMDIAVALLLVIAAAGIGFGLWRTRRA